MTYWKQIRSGRAVLLGVMILTALFFAFPAFAGWNPDGSRTTYTDETGTPVKGFHTIQGHVYFFNEGGFLQTGWVMTPSGLRYFYEDGQIGEKLGSMASDSVITVGRHMFGFDREGALLTGFQKMPGGNYYFLAEGDPGSYGRAATNMFADLPDGRRAYFLENGQMAYDRWVEDHTYYVDATGNLMRSSVTRDGYIIKADGKAKKRIKTSQFVKLNGKWYFYRKGKGILKDQVFLFKRNRYYVDENGIRQTGWIYWGGHDYYFQVGGKAATGKKKIGGKTYTFNKRGQLKTSRVSAGTKAKTGKASILILCGHGQGDSGAVGCNGAYKEAEYTRDFGKRIYQALLKKPDNVNVHLFNTNYDMFQQMKTTVARVGSFSGNGSRRRKVLNALKNNSRIPDPLQYDFVLEVHFNATAQAGKDPNGNGVKKGTGTYVNINKSSAERKIDKKIITALNHLGMGTWGSGVFGSSTLLNAKVFTEVGVNYTLLETCFIDDKDDMKFYLNRRDDMAQAVADAVVEFFA